MPNPISTGDFRDHFIPYFTKRIKGNIERRMKNAEWKMIFTTDTADTDIVESSQMEAAGPAQLTMEGGKHATIRIEEGYKKKIAQTQWKAKVEYTDKARHFVKTKLLTMATDALPTACTEVQEVIGAGYIEYGDTALASVPTVRNIPLVDSICGDGLTIFNATHTFRSDAANTYANRTAAWVSLTQSALQDATDAVEGWKDNTGACLMVRTKGFVCSPSYRWKFYELLHSQTASETTNRADNALRQTYGPNDFRIYYHIVNATEWLVETDWMNDFCYYYGWKPTIQRWEDKDAGIFSIGINFCMGHGVNDPRHWYANKAN